MYRLYFLLLLSLVSCESKTETETSKSTEINASIDTPKDLSFYLSRVKNLEDSITTEVTKNPDIRIGSFVFLDLINRLKDVVVNYPNAQESASCLFKLHMKYGEMKAYNESIAYGDTLLQRFPEFKDRNLIFQSIATTYDIFIKPRDTKKVKFYLEQLLTSKSIPEEEKMEIKNRLKYINLDLLTYSSKQKNKQFN